MLDLFRSAPRSAGLMEQITSLAGCDPFSARDEALLSRNVVSSLLTAGASLVLLERLRASEIEPVALAGYSVGQWVALHAAGALGRDALLGFIAARARVMDEVMEAVGPGGMLAVIGVGRGPLGLLCQEAQAAGGVLEIANDNAPGQLTLSGDAAGLAFAERRLPSLQPRRVRRLAVAGAWHSRLMGPAVPRLTPLIDALGLQPLRLPLIDNATGGWLDAGAPTATLARHVAGPVLWAQGIRTMADAGASSFIEVGYGDMLSRFGFFIDRDRRHLPMAPSARRRA